MNRKILILLLFFVLFSTGCTSSRGIIDLNSRPREATVYLDGVEQGVTPVQFEYDFKIPARLEIVKDGYYIEDELLNEAWVVREIRKGNYSEGRYMIGGVNSKSWMVNTYRRLEKKEE